MGKQTPLGVEQCQVNGAKYTSYDIMKEELTITYRQSINPLGHSVQYIRRLTEI